MYTESELYFEDDAVLNIHDLGAGMELYDVDTDALDHPYAPSEAKPFHVLDWWTTDGHTFTSNLYGEPAAVNVWCVDGRDNGNQQISDWNHSEFENLEGIDTKCASRKRINRRLDVIRGDSLFKDEGLSASLYHIGDVVWSLLAVITLLAAFLYHRDSLHKDLQRE